MVVDITDIVTYTNFGEHRLRGFWVAWVKFSPFPLTLIVRVCDAACVSQVNMKVGGSLLLLVMLTASGKFKTRCKAKPDVSPPGCAPSRLCPLSSMHYFCLRPATHMHMGVRT